MNAVIGTLRYINFGENFITGTELLYHNFQSCAINYGYIADWFYPTRGLHQGAPESSFIFVLVVETLGMEIRNNKNIKGIVVSDIQFKSVQFADDMHLLIKYGCTKK